MKTKSIMKKSAFMTRRKIIIYIIVTILILGIVAGFTDPFITDNTIHSAGLDEIIVIESEPPAKGSPEDYDLISNLKFAAYKLHHSSFFRGETNGKVVADLGFTTYTQNIHNTRYASSDNIVFAETISASSMKSVAEQKWADNGIIIYRPSTSVNGSSAKFSDKAYQISYEKYSKDYGTVPNQLSKYIINEETILDVKDENAKVKASANASENAKNVGFDFYVPEKLVADENGNYKFTVKLDATKSTLYYRNEVRTLGGADQNPKFYSVSATITIDKNWNPISVKSVETYDIAIPVLGAMSCTGTLTEVFTQIGDQTAVVPEREFFQPYVDEAKRNPSNPPVVIPPSGSTSPADYLAAAFADYLTGAKNLDLAIDMNIAGMPAYDLILSLNIGNMNIDAMLGDLYVKFANDKVNIKLHELNGYLSTDKFAELAANDKIGELLGGLGEFDILSLFGGDILGTVFSDCEMTSENGVTRIHMPFSIDLKPLGIDGVETVGVDASIYILDDGKKLKSITGEITAFGKTITVDAKPLKTAPAFPSVNGAKDLSGIVDFIPDIVETTAQKTFGIVGSIVVDGKTVRADAYVDLTDGLKIDATIDALGAKLSIKCIDGYAYVTLGNIEARGTTAELPALIDAILGYVDIESFTDLIKSIMPRSINELVGMIENFTVTDNSLSLDLGILSSPVNISLERRDGKISGFDFGMNLNLLGIKLNAFADVDVTYPERRNVEAPTGNDFVTFAQLARFIKDIEPYTAPNVNYTAAINGSISDGASTYSVNGRFDIDRPTDGEKTGVAVAGVLSAMGREIEFTFADGIAYASLGNIKVKFSAADADKLSSPAMRIISMFVDLSSVDPSQYVAPALSTVKSLTIDEDGAASVVIETGGVRVTVAFDPRSGKINIVGNGISLSIDVTVTESSHGISRPTDANDYADAAQLGVTLDAVADMIENKELSANIEIATNGETFYAVAALSLKNGLKLKLASNELGLNVTVIGDTAYIAYGDLRVSGTLADITAALDAAGAVIPDEVRAAIDKLSDFSSISPELSQTVDALNAALDSIKTLTVKDGMLDATIVYDALTVRATASLALDKFFATVTDATGKTTRLSVTDISPACTAIAVPDGSFAQAREIITAVAPLLPLAAESAFDITVNAELYGVAIIGNVYFDLGVGSIDTLQAEAKLTVGDLPVTVTVKNGELYLAIDDGMRLAQPLNEVALLSLVDRLDPAMPGIKATVVRIIDAIKALTIGSLLDSLSLAPSPDGFVAAIDLTAGGLDVKASVAMTNADGALESIAIDLNAFGISVCAAFDSVISDGRLSSLVGTRFTVSDIPMSIDIGLRGAERRTVEDISGCAPLSEIADLIGPFSALANNAAAMNSATFNIGAFVLTSENKQTTVKGQISLSLAPLAVDMSLTLFDGTQAAEKLNLKYVGNAVYVQSGNIMLSFDTTTDLQRLYDVISQYLPEYLNDEIAKLFGMKQGTSVFSEVTLIIDRIKEIAAVDGDPEQTVKLLFAGLNGLSGDSAIKSFAQKVRLFKRDNKVTVALTALGITLNVTPELAIVDGKAVLDGLSIDTSIAGMLVRIGVESYTLSDATLEIRPPQNTADYVSIAEFAEMLHNGVNTLTTTDSQGNITFELQTFEFDYETYKIETVTDASGNTVNVKDELGRDKPLTDASGAKVTDSKIKVTNKPGMSALKGKFIKHERLDENGEPQAEYKFNLEAHVVIEVDTLVHVSPIMLDLYVINDERYPNGLAFIDYLEANSGNNNGERISIDYTSIMQIVAAVMDIVGADNDTVEMLLGDYRQKIDISVFESMDIAGIDVLRDLLNGIADAVRSSKLALEDISSAWDLVKTAGDVETLRARMDDINAKLDSGMAQLKAAIAAFGSSDTPQTPPVDPNDNEINGLLYKQIVNGVTLRKDANRVSATVDNELVTQTEGTAEIAVTQNQNVIDSIRVSSLDVNTAKLNGFNAMFTAGQNVDIALPDNYNTNTDKSTYSDFANIKYLLFDLMNTANLMEFEMGDVNNATDENNITLNIGLDKAGLVNLKIKYNIKVKLIDLGANANPRYKTAAVVEFIFKDCKAIGAQAIYDDTTRLYFYDNVIYIEGVEWYVAKTSIIGTKTWGRRRVQVKYTLDDLSRIMSSGDAGLEKFMYEFLFYLLPLSRSFTLFAIDMQTTIKDAAIKMVMNTDNRTFAKVFKGYNYNTETGKHELKIGLKELTGVSEFSDVDLAITGANDNDDNILDNYISHLHLSTKFVDMVTLSLDAKLNNATVYNDNADGVNKIRSGGLTHATNGNTLDEIISSVIPSTNWSQIWAA